VDDDRLARARAGDLDAFLDLVRPRAGRLLRLAAIAGGDPEAARPAVAGAIRIAWRGVRGLPSELDLDRRLEVALTAHLPRRLAADATPLDRALRPLAPGERLALARCLDPRPDATALAVAGRAGVEIPASGPPRGGPVEAIVGDIVDLDGPLAGWDLPRLQAALAAAAGAPDTRLLVGDLRAELAGRPPDRAGIAALRSIAPRPIAVARALALGLAVVVGAGTIAWATSRPDEEAAAAGPAVATPAPTAPPATRSVAGLASDTPGDFPAEIHDLRVIGINEALGRADDPTLGGRSLAIRGWLTRPAFREPCAATDDPVAEGAAFCRREAVLREAPGDEWRVAHLHPQLLPGTGLGRVRRAFAAAGDDPVPVVVIAHFGDPRAAPCTAAGRHCGDELVIDRVAWALGAPVRPPVAVLPEASPGAGTPAAADARLSGWDAMSLAEETYGGIRGLSASGVPAAALELVEPAAAGAVASPGLTWLVRAIVDPRPSDPLGATRTWLVVDDASGAVMAAPGAVASSAWAAGPGFLFPRQVDGTPVRSVTEALSLVETRLPEGSLFAVAGWLGTPSLAGSCLAEASRVDRPLAPDAPFCRRGAVLRGPTPGGRALYLQLPPGTPALPIDAAVGDRRMPVPVVALVESGSPRSEPCWPTDNGCGRELALERLLWVDGAATDVAVAELDAPGVAAPRLSADLVRALAEEAVGDAGRVVSIVRVPAARRGDVAPGAEQAAIAGDHAWIVRLRSEAIGAGAGAARLELLWWLLVDDASGIPVAGSRTIAGVPVPASGARLS
jgi:hypothetical protein